jgi:cytochrome c
LSILTEFSNYAAEVHDFVQFKITDGPVKNLRICVFAAIAFSGSVSAASAQDAAQGEKVFLKCKACHQIGEGAKNAVGPVLNGIVGRKAGTYADYSYSDANKNSGLTWDEATLKEYLKNPRAKVPGTKMIFPGLPKDEDIDNVMAYLKQFGADGKKS